jgi:hypothetical protein
MMNSTIQLDPCEDTNSRIVVMATTFLITIFLIAAVSASPPMEMGE